MLSRALIRTSQFGQCDGGATIDSPRGTRQMTTFRKLPRHAPSNPAYRDATAVRRARVLLARGQLAPGALHQARCACHLRAAEAVRVEDDRRLFTPDQYAAGAVDRHAAVHDAATAQVDDRAGEVPDVAPVHDSVEVDGSGELSDAAVDHEEAGLGRRVDVTVAREPADRCVRREV